MEYRLLGKTGLRVSALGFGCGNVGGLMVRGTPAERERAIARALELGINYFDTAPSYGDGQSERHLGQALKALKADVYVGTKFRLSSADMGDVRGAIGRSLAASLTRLGMEHVDLLQLHNHIAPERGGGALGVGEVLDEVVPALEALQRQGKIRFYGITGFGETAALHQAIAAGALHAVQVCYNLLNPSAGVELPPGFPAQDFRRLLDRAGEQRMGVIGIRVLAAGALSATEARHPIAAPSVDPLASGPDYRTDVERARILGALVDEGLVQSLIEASLRFALSTATVSTLLVGYSSLDHLEYAAAAVARGPLPGTALARLSSLWQQLATPAK
ncbi:MAG: aldo/keto reductase [Candidatus Rokubacteria bacterium]|nr:aldo/keto reductase [Candidatus Rokubacteria bacterium]